MSERKQSRIAKVFKKLVKEGNWTDLTKEESRTIDNRLANEWKTIHNKYLSLCRQNNIIVIREQHGLERN